MKNIFTIFNREIKAYFGSAIAYIFIIVFLLISLNLFMPQFFLAGSADMRGFFYPLPIILCVFLSAVTMRSWAEDRRGNTLELLLTFPMKTSQLVTGKFLACLAFYLLALSGTFTIVIMLSFLGRPDFGAIVCQYLGAIFMGGFFIALGILISGFCKDQIVSFIISMMASFMVFLLGLDFIAGSIDGWIPGLGTFLRNSIGMTQHFAAFSKGVIDVKDILYYVIGAALFLALNGFWLESRLRPKAKSIFTLSASISLGIFVVFNFIFADLPIKRFDFTEGKIYTVSSVSAGILRGLKAPVLLKLYISPTDKMPVGLKTLENDIRDKLDEFKAASGGKLEYKVFHLEAANIGNRETGESLEKQIETKGIRPFQVKSIEADELGVRLVYSAMTISYKEKPDEILPHVTPGDIPDLEYKIISKLFKMDLPEPPKVALVAPIMELPPTPEALELMREAGRMDARRPVEDEYVIAQKLLEYEGYNVSRIRLTEDETIPGGTKTLIMIDPRFLNDRQKYEVNRFLVNGGSVFLAVQQYLFEYKPVSAEGFAVSSVDQKPEVNSLIEKWGVTVDTGFLMDNQCEVVSIEGGRIFGIFSIAQPVKLPIQIKIVQDQMNSGVSITSRLATMLYMWGGAIKLDTALLKELSIKAIPLIMSSPEAWTIPYHPGDLTPADIMMPPAERRKVFTLAALLEGQFPDAFKGKEVPSWPKDEGPAALQEKPKEDAPLSPRAGRMIIIGCARMFTKVLFQQGGHMNFFLNSIDALTLGEKLIEIRSKAPINRSLKRIASTAKVLWRAFVMFFVPCALAIVGAYRVVSRRRAKSAYLNRM